MWMCLGSSAYLGITSLVNVISGKIYYFPLFIMTIPILLVAVLIEGLRKDYYSGGKDDTRS
jgi:hypothetical protein